jgi:hypothetical protein
MKKSNSLNFSVPLQFGFDAFTKDKNEAQKFAEVNNANIKETTHTLRGKGWLIFK